MGGVGRVGQVNGSRIRSWWIQHHYWSIATCLILLVLPVDSPAVQFCINKFLWWAWWCAPPPPFSSSAPFMSRPPLAAQRPEIAPHFR